MVGDALISFQNFFREALNPIFADVLAVRQDVPDPSSSERHGRSPRPQPSSADGRAGVSAANDHGRGLHPRHGPLRSGACRRREDRRLAGNVDHIVRVHLIVVFLRGEAQQVAADRRDPRDARSRVPILPHLRAHRRGGPPLPALRGEGATTPREVSRR